MLIDPHKQTYYDKKLKTEVVVWRNSWIDSLFIYAMVFSLLFEIIKTNIQKNSGHYTDINKPKIEITQTNNSLPTPTPTIYKCPVINQKTKEDIDRENAEKNLSSYTYQINYPNKKIVKVNFLEKKLLPCNYFDENYCQLKNEDKWIIKYPKNWQLYRIKKQVFDTYYDDNNPLTFYDLKFENGLSYFYLEEIITLGGNPSTLSRNQWNYIKNYCQNLFYSTDDGFENFICYGNILNCSYNIDGYFDQVYSINSYYKSFIQINSQIQKDETLIYDWYIPSIHFEESTEIKALRAYVFSTNFYSNDEQFIDEAIKMYLSAYLSFNKK